MRSGTREVKRLMAALVAAATVAACSGGGDDNGTGPTPTIDIALSGNTLSVAQGASGTLNLTLTRGGGFAGAVTIDVTGEPTDVTATPAPASIAAGSTSSVITIAAGAGATAGTTTLTVHAAGTGVTEKTATFQLTITAAPAGGFTLTIDPTTLTVQQGTNGTVAVNIARTAPFGGAVNLAVTAGLPNGVTPAFSPTSATGNLSTLTLTASPTATVGQSNVTITGTGTGVANQTVTLALTVSAASGGTGNTTWDFCTADQTPIWFAAQDGNGTWTRVNPTGTKFVFDILSGKGGVAYVTSATSPSISAARSLARRMSGVMQTVLLMQNKAAEVRTASRYAAKYASSLVDSFDTAIFYGTQAELNSQGTTQCLAGTGKTVNGTVANVAAGQTADVTLGDASQTVTGPATTFQLTDVPDGSLDLIASRSTINQTTFETVVDKIIIRRGLNQANNSTLAVLDFNAAEAFAPAQANITVNNLGTDLAGVFTAFFTAGASGASLFNGFSTGTGPFKYYGVPTANQAAGDLHFALVGALPAGGTSQDIRLAGLFFKDPTDRTVTLGAAMPAQTVSVAATTPYVRLRATGSVTAAYNKVIDVTFTQPDRGVTITATAGYLSNATSYDFTIPDLSGVAGWDNNWALKPGVATEWMVTGFGFTGIGVSEPAPVEGATVQGAANTGTITP